jgi:hypothetical protein
MTWPSLLLVLAFGMSACQRAASGAGSQVCQLTCDQVDAILFRHIGAEDKPIFPVFIGLVGQQYPPPVREEPCFVAYDTPHVVDSTFYVALAATIRHSLPVHPQVPDYLGEFGTFSICVGQEQFVLESHHDAVRFFQAFLPRLVPTTPAERALKADLEVMARRLGP